jgi:uncharacterized surface protein with fasciclin (FAS1) repeats
LDIPKARTIKSEQKKMKLITSIATAIALFAPLTAQAEKSSKAAPTIVGIAASNVNFTTLVAAAKAAGLVETLSGKGPFTVFAPTDEAFKKLPAGTVESLLKPENKGKLAAILKYHVVSGKVMAADVNPGKVTTVQGSKATIKATDGKVTIDGANVVKTDIVGSNGVIHVIDAVILPKG